MLADLAAGRPLELDPLVGAVLEIAELVGADCPRLRAVYACTKLLEEVTRWQREPPAALAG